MLISYAITIVVTPKLGQGKEETLTDVEGVLTDLADFDIKVLAVKPVVEGANYD